MIRKTRKMTVYKTTGAGYQHVPQIIQIACQKNRLVISKNDPAQAD